MEKDPSPLDTLRQLKEWLDAGTITPAEFDTLKRQLLFNETAPSPAPVPPPPVAPVAPPVVSAPPVPPVAPALPVEPVAPPVASVPPIPPVAAPPVAPIVVPPVPEPTVISAPVEEPSLPPIVHYTPEAVPPVAPPTAPAPPAESFSRPFESGRPEASPSAEEVYDMAPLEPVEEDEEMPYVAPARSPLSTILIVGGILALLALVAYLMLGNRESEHLSSTSQTGTDSLQVAPETGPQAEQIDLPPAAVPETVRVVPVAPPVTAPAVDSSAMAPAPTTAPAETAADEAAARGRIEGVLSSYYEDMKATPFSAASYFAPTVERFYTLQNTTPAAINDELAKTHFPEFLEADSQIEPGTLQVSEPVADGSRVVTFTEKSTALRQSLQKHQQTRAQVRVRFDRNFKIKYLRQERLLENTFTD